MLAPAANFGKEDCGKYLSPEKFVAAVNKIWRPEQILARGNEGTAPPGANFARGCA